jgi:hypothetical protein
VSSVHNFKYSVNGYLMLLRAGIPKIRCKVTRKFELGEELRRVLLHIFNLFHNGKSSLGDQRVSVYCALRAPKSRNYVPWSLVRYIKERRVGGQRGCSTWSRENRDHTTIQHPKGTLSQGLYKICKVMSADYICVDR